MGKFFFEKYFSDYQKILNDFLCDANHQYTLDKALELLNTAKKNGKNLLIIGNGGSMAIAEHMAVDFTKNAKLRTFTLSNTSLLSAYANDFHYEAVFQKMIEDYGCFGDVLIAISSSGASKNILNACEIAKAKKMSIITLSGFSEENPLRKGGDLNFWVNSKAYGYVELIHNLILHYLNDAMIGSAEYQACPSS